MAVNFCTMPTQHGTTGILFPKLTAQLKFPKIQIIYIWIYIYRFIYLYKKTNSSMLCINSSNSFSKFCSHLNKIIETSSTWWDSAWVQSKRSAQSRMALFEAHAAWRMGGRGQGIENQLQSWVSKSRVGYVGSRVMFNMPHEGESDREIYRW